MKLHISDTFSLPVEAVTQTFAVLAKRGAGKTYTASVMAEEMLKAKQQIVALDPTGAWWGLRSEFPVAVFGGEHGNLPLEETAGETVAAAIVENRFPAVLDLQHFRKGQSIRFMVAFAETLYRLNREPLHLFVDEADAFAPQGRSYGGDENRMLGAMEDIVRRGRKKGIGCTLITQRPAVLNKNVLTQCESLFALRLVHPKDIDAVMEWVHVHADEEQAKEMVESLPTLAIGEAWLWSPGWLGLMKRLKVRKRETFDSSATPKPGETVKQPRSLAEIDLAALGEKIKATVERAKENDPKELKKKIADLEKKLRERPAETIVEKEIERVEIPVLKDGQLDKALTLVNRLEGLRDRIGEMAADLSTKIMAATVAPIVTPPRPAPALPRPRPAIPRSTLTPRPAVVTEVISGPQQRILDALAWLETVQVPQAKKTQIALLSDQSPTSSAFGNNLGALRSAGLIQYPAGGMVCLTDPGRAAANVPETPPTSEAMHQMLFARLPRPQGRILDALIAAYPDALAKEDLANETDQSPTSSAYGNNLGALRSLGLIDYPAPGQVVALPVLFID